VTETPAPYAGLPWYLFVAGNPIPKGRPRVVDGHAYTPKRTQEYEALVRDAAALRWHGEPEQKDIQVWLTFYRENRRRVDIDNLAKAILDALNGLVWKDDAQIQRLVLEREVRRAEPGVEITVRRA
jgi:Holliday junction resolvase RusA-like endonuclease